MVASVAISVDGSRIAYQVEGSGSALILLHGGFQSRAIWEPYRERLARSFLTISMDLRGHGESDRPQCAQAYSIARHCEDVLSVAAACAVEQFDLWGYSLGANIGRFLAVRSQRVRRFVMTGVPFGAGVEGEFRAFIERTRDHWTPLLQARAVGRLALEALSLQDRTWLATGQVETTLAWLTAMLDWPTVIPEDLRCRTLWMVGSENTAAMHDLRARAQTLQSTEVRALVLEGLTHAAELSATEMLAATVLEFLSSDRWLPAAPCPLEAPR